MRTSDSLEDHSALYIDDIDADGNLITGQCRERFYYDTKEACPEFVDRIPYGEPTYCPKCGIELFYRSWYEW